MFKCFESGHVHAVIWLIMKVNLRRPFEREQMGGILPVAGYVAVNASHTSVFSLSLECGAETRQQSS